MNSKDTYDIALKIGDVALRNLQFFIAICTVFGGWIIGGDTFIKMTVIERFMAAIVFTVPTFGLLVGEVQILKRLNAALDVSRDFFQKEQGELPEAANRLFALGHIGIAGFAMGGTIVSIDLLIFVRGCLPKTNLGNVLSFLPG